MTLEEADALRDAIDFGVPPLINLGGGSFDETLLDLRFRILVQLHRPSRTVLLSRLILCDRYSEQGGLKTTGTILGLAISHEMSVLHVHGKATPTSKVVRNRNAPRSPLKAAAAAASPIKRPAARPAARSHDYASQVTGHGLPVEADFRGLDVLSAMDYLKRLQSEFPPRLSRERRTDLLNRRRNLPDIVLGHQIASLFPNMPALEREINDLVTAGRLVRLALQDGDPAYIRREDYRCPPELLTLPTSELSDSQFRAFSQGGYLLRRRDVVVLSAPNMGAYFSALRAARKFVLAHLRNSAGAGIALEKDVKTRYEVWKDGGIFQFENLMHDLVGSARVEVLMLTVGRALKITKRGREDR